MVATVTTNGPNVEAKRAEIQAEVQQEKWMHWPIHWSGIWTGALAASAAVLLFGLIGIAIGAHLLTPEHRVVDLRKIALGTLIYSVVSAFLSFVIAGWVSVKIGGILRSEPAIIHGAITWLLAVPLLMVLATLGAGAFFGSWYGGLSGTPSWGTHAGAPFERPEAPGPNATPAERTQYREAQTSYRAKVDQWNQDTPQVTRNSALGAITALLLGLIGAVVGSWMASGEPMTFTHHWNRSTQTSARIQV